MNISQSLLNAYQSVKYVKGGRRGKIIGFPSIYWRKSGGKKEVKAIAMNAKCENFFFEKIARNGNSYAECINRKLLLFSGWLLYNLLSSRRWIPDDSGNLKHMIVLNFRDDMQMNESMGRQRWHFACLHQQHKTRILDGEDLFSNDYGAKDEMTRYKYLLDTHIFLTMSDISFAISSKCYFRRISFAKKLKRVEKCYWGLLGVCVMQLFNSNLISVDNLPVSFPIVLQLTRIIPGIGMKN